MLNGHYEKWLATMAKMPAVENKSKISKEDLEKHAVETEKTLFLMDAEMQLMMNELVYLRNAIQLADMLRNREMRMKSANISGLPG